MGADVVGRSVITAGGPEEAGRSEAAAVEQTTPSRTRAPTSTVGMRVMGRLLRDAVRGRRAERSWGRRSP